MVDPPNGERKSYGTDVKDTPIIEVMSPSLDHCKVIKMCIATYQREQEK